jgi:hypothetical protein
MLTDCLMSTIQHVWTLRGHRHILAFYLKNENVVYKTITEGNIIILQNDRVMLEEYF